MVVKLRKKIRRMDNIAKHNLYVIVLILLMAGAGGLLWFLCCVVLS
jgi:hypothetical protein